MKVKKIRRHALLYFDHPTELRNHHFHCRLCLSSGSAPSFHLGIWRGCYKHTGCSATESVNGALLDSSRPSSLHLSPARVDHSHRPARPPPPSRKGYGRGIRPPPASAEPRQVKIQLVSESGGRLAHWQKNDLENHPVGSESLTCLEDGYS